MPTSKTDNVDTSAEQRFSEAFERLKLGVPEILPKGTPVSQNNVAKEAGCSDTSALRKSRYPLLIIKIQEWVATQRASGGNSVRQMRRSVSIKNRSYRETIADFKLQRDATAGLLSDANLQIVLLTEENNHLRARLDAVRPSPSVLKSPQQVG